MKFDLREILFKKYNVKCCKPNICDYPIVETIIFPNFIDFEHLNFLKKLVEKFGEDFEKKILNDYITKQPHCSAKSLFLKWKKERMKEGYKVEIVDIK